MLSSNTLPEWCNELTYSCPMSFPFETRLLFFQCTAFGASRSIVWLQNQRDQNVERTRGGMSRLREDIHEFRVDRIKHERVKVPRGDKILDWAIQVMRVHAERKSILEVEFLDEEGTGLGLTLEFFALVAAELQRKDLCMWICSDEEDELKGKGQEEISHRPPGYYVTRPNGLFPAPLPQDGELCAKVAKLFWFLGVFLAKTLQDNRLVDLPLSYPFLKLLCQGEMSPMVREKSHIIQSEELGGNAAGDIMTSSTLSVLSEESDPDTFLIEKASSETSSPSPQPSSSPWYTSLLTIDDPQRRRVRRTYPRIRRRQRYPEANRGFPQRL